MTPRDPKPPQSLWVVLAWEQQITGSFAWGCEYVAANRDEAENHESDLLAEHNSLRTLVKEYYASK